jgi:hypothetical protein
MMVFLSKWNNIPILETVTECRMTEHRMTERRLTDCRMTAGKKLPKVENY